MSIAEVSHTMARRARHSFVSTGSGLTPRMTDLAEHMLGVLPERSIRCGSLSTADILTEEHWQSLTKGARFRIYRRGRAAVEAGEVSDGLYQVHRKALVMICLRRTVAT